MVIFQLKLNLQYLTDCFLFCKEKNNAGHVFLDRRGRLLEIWIFDPVPLGKRSKGRGGGNARRFRGDGVARDQWACMGRGLALRYKTGCAGCARGPPGPRARDPCVDYSAYSLETSSAVTSGRAAAPSRVMYFVASVFSATALKWYADARVPVSVS